MANVLPKKNRVALRRNYWLRLAITFTFMVTAAMTIGSVSMVPAYLSSNAELGEVTQYQEIQGETREAAKRDTAVQKARTVNTQIESVIKTGQASAVESIQHVMEDWEVHAEDIIISGFDYDLKEMGDKEMPQLRISGEARDRASLNSFVQTLRANQTFSSVSFPVSDLAEGELVNFSVTLQFES